MEITYLFRKPEMNVELRAHLIQKMADMAMQADVILSEREVISNDLQR